MTDKIVVFCTCGSPEEAETLARMLVERRLAACVNIVPSLRSIYRWQGKIEDAAEWLLLIKTSRARFEELSETLRAAHSYQVPEILALPAIAGSPDYLAWIEKETSPAQIHE
jgi:periplasmic divalent cation tolerance protein